MANQMLVLRREKYMQEQQAMAQQNAQMNAQMQQQSAMQSAQLKQQEMQGQMQMEQAQIQMKSQVELQRMQAEFELKNQFEEQQHSRRLREIELGNLGKEGTASLQGETRKNVQQQSAVNQSEMIEQRKGNRGSLKDEGEEIEE